MSFEKVLVANRGEIARRVMRTCRQLGLTTVAVYSDADAEAPHVTEADEAVRLGPAPAAESYLLGDAIIEAARRTGAEAIHPGYGFLAENADFAAAVAKAGLTFIGPSAGTIREMGDKAAARSLMASRGVPVAPGYAGPDQTTARFAEEATRIGYPVLVKAAAGGGGKGMNIVERADALAGAVEQARRIAASAFGDDTLIIEKYIRDPRHIEVQIMGDTHGRVIHCFERECSIQRRFQKIIEEAPSVAVDGALRAQLCGAALTAGEALGYTGAGTVEFIMAPDGQFYFLEVNTRLQVEHPVTEMITGLDLVALQIEVAMGGHLPTQDAVVRRGHAVECRLYAEDPARGFLPATGTLVEWHTPELPHVRFDAGVVDGGEVGIHYDPMLAKVIAWGPDRGQANRRMIGALKRMGVQGVTTNRAFLLDVLRHPAYGAGALSTDFIPRHLGDWAERTAPATALSRVVAAALYDASDRTEARRMMPGIRPGWSNNPGEPLRDVWVADEAEYRVGYRVGADGRYTVFVDDATLSARVIARADRALELEIGEVDDAHPIRRTFTVVTDGAVRWVRDLDGSARIEARPRFPDAADDEIAGGCVAPMPGKVVKVFVTAGEAVSKGAPLLILEAMKMEQTLSAPDAGVVSAVHAAEGDVVDAGAVLVEIETPDGEPGA